MTTHTAPAESDRVEAQTSVARKVIDRVRPLRTVVKSDLGQRLTQTARGAAVVDASSRFAALELRGTRAADYRLRKGGMRVTLRHGTRDIALLNEIFGGTGGSASCYEPPADVSRALAARDAPRILDLGANIGLFGIFALSRWPSATITAYEPDPGNARLLARTIAANGLGDRWEIVPAAVAEVDGVVSFVAGCFSESRIAGAAEPGTIEVPAVDLFALDLDVDLLKMDIEGGEWAILGDPRLATLRARTIVLEWHRRNAPGPDARAEAIALLQRAGYPNIWNLLDDGPDVGVLWAWRQ